MNNEIDNIIHLMSLYLSGEATPKDAEVLMKWKNASAENLAQFNQFVSVWEQLGNTSSAKNIDIDEEWRIHKAEYIKTERKIGLWAFKSVMKVAASLLILVGLSVVGWFYFSGNSVKTEIASVQDVVLPDGSIVTLNANSKLSYSNNYGKENRSVRLRGEAFFKVTKNAKLPFVINTGAAEIKVLGTSFNVKSYNEMETVEVTVSEGRVSVYEKNNLHRQVFITSGQKAIYNKNSGVISTLVNENVNYNAWKTKTIAFDNDNLQYVIKTLSDVYHVEIILLNKELNQCTLTTSFDNVDLVTVLKILKSTLNIKVEVRDNIIYISGKAC